MNTSRKLSKRERLNNLAWPFFIFLVVVLPSFMIHVAVGIIVTGCIIFLCWKFYSKDEITDKDIELQKRFEQSIDKILGWFKVASGWFLVVFFLWAVVSAVFWPNTKQEKSAKEYKMASSEFIRMACHAKTVCKNYGEARQNCAAAGSIEECIKIKMQGEDFSSCKDDGSVLGFEDALMPNFAQCIGNKFVSPK